MEHPRCLARKHPSVARAFLILATAARLSATASFISAACATAVPEARGEEAGGLDGGAEICVFADVEKRTAIQY